MNTNKPKFVLDFERQTGLTCELLKDWGWMTEWNVLTPTGYCLMTIGSSREDCIGAMSLPGLNQFYPDKNDKV